MLDRLKYYADTDSPGSVARKNGVVMGFSSVSPDEARRAGLKPSSDNGRYIALVLPDSVAARAGVVKGDMFIRYAGKTMDSENAIVQALAKTKPGSIVPVEIERDGQVMKLNFSFPKPTSHSTARIPKS